VRIGISGSWKEKDREHWDLRSDLNSFKNACYQLGLVIAKTGAEITVGSGSEFTADKHVVEGYVSKYSKGLSVRVVRPKKGRLPFAELTKSIRVPSSMYRAFRPLGDTRARNLWPTLMY
jgi:hypothetical protein